MNEHDNPDSTEPEIYSLKRGDSVWKLNRRRLLEGSSAATASALLTGCKDETESPDEPEENEAVSPFAMVEPIGKGHTHEVTGIVAFQDRMFTSGVDGQLLVWDLKENRLIRSLDAKSDWGWQALSGCGKYIGGVSGYPPTVSCWKEGKDSTGLPVVVLDVPELEGRIHAGFEGDFYYLDLKGVIYAVDMNDPAQMPHRFIENGVGETTIAIDVQASTGIGTIAWLAKLDKGDFVVRSAEVKNTSEPVHMLWLDDDGEDFLLHLITRLDGSSTIVVANRQSGKIHLVGDSVGKKKFTPRRDALITTVASGKTSAGEWIAFGYEDGKVFLVSLDGRLIGTFQAHSGDVTAMTAIPDSSKLATGGADRAVRVWDLTKLNGTADGEGETDLTDHDGNIEIDIEIEIEVRVKLTKNYTVKNWAKTEAPQSLASTPLRTSRSREDLEQTKKNRPPTRPASSPSRPSTTSSGRSSTTISNPSVISRTYHYWRPN